MSILRQSPWYQEILEEVRTAGLEEGRERGVEEALVRVLERRLGPVPSDMIITIQSLNLQQLQNLLDVALEAKTWSEFQAQLPPTSSAN